MIPALLIACDCIIDVIESEIARRGVAPEEFERGSGVR